MRPYRLTEGSKFWVKSGSTLIPVSKSSFTAAIRRQAEIVKQKRKKE